MFRPIFLSFSLLALAPISNAVQANDSATKMPQAIPAAEFSQCVERLTATAQSQGIDNAATLRVLKNARFLENVIGYDRRQPEFVQTFPNYLNKRVTQWRIDKGRTLLKKHKILLDSLSEKYGIPPHYIMAFWGLETNFGTIKGKMPIIDSLVTLACDQRRSEFFTKELMLALQLFERENLTTEKMVGSWAGAMGHTQFMPSAYMAYALDGDNDNRVDLWESEADAFTSAANFLHHLGWQRGYRWGREIQLPAGFDYSLAGRHTKLSLTQWAAKGVTKADGAELGKGELSASVLVPSGHEGPAFLIYDNFKVIMRWNNSESYALAVGYLADRIVGSPKLTASLPDHPNFTVDEMKSLQAALKKLNFDVGEIDGIYGPATRSALQAFQSSQGLVADGYPAPSVNQKVLSQAQM
ncbi:lytic murein transglycosylase [Aestuariibacter sp. AA17]|uniref:Lytic murein transglycosylase n=1 Tax=Fluctibacter corallii TaxID=2984329 RepID=A0ABT3A4C7_9ALTE|nr:lytic murein transglycosylase [Aestuariibacter sp. AA17]MCV2883504.1 lytic murein transglycosylase [Aestuariibacter sp. AA17]